MAEPNGRRSPPSLQAHQNADGQLVFTRHLAEGEHNVTVDRATLRPLSCDCQLSAEGLVCRATLEVATIECVAEARQRSRDAYDASRSANDLLERVLIAAGRAQGELVHDGLELQLLEGAS